MSNSKHFRWTALATLLVGLVLAIASGWFDQEAVLAKDDAVARSASAVSSRLFAVASVFILITAIELQYARTASRIHELETRLSSIKKGDDNLKMA